MAITEGTVFAFKPTLKVQRENAHRMCLLWIIKLLRQ